MSNNFLQPTDKKYYRTINNKITHLKRFLINTPSNLKKNSKRTACKGLKKKCVTKNGYWIRLDRPQYILYMRQKFTHAFSHVQRNFILTIRLKSFTNTKKIPSLIHLPSNNNPT